MTQSNWAAGADRHLIRRAMKAPMLARDEELNYARAWHEKQCVHSLEKLTESYLRLVISVASRYRHYGLPAADLIQEGTVGLMEAAARFETDRDVRFSTYANWWIRAAIQDFLLRNWSIVRTGTTAAHKALFFNLKRLKARIGESADRPLTHESRRKIAEEMNVRLKDVEAMEGRLSGTDRSLNAPVSDDSAQEWQELLVCEAPEPEQAVMEQHDGERYQELIKKAMEGLNGRESLIISRRRLSEDNVTLAALGDELGISKERVRQLEAQALIKLKQALISEVGCPVEAGLASA